MKKIMLLGSGELGKEFCISAKRLGCHVIAVDNYEGAPAMSVADEFAVIDMLDGQQLEELASKHRPDFIVPEIESIRTEKLLELEKKGFCIIPTATATKMTMDRVAIRDLAANELKLKTAKFEYATNIEELKRAVEKIKLPCVIKPVMSSSGKGQSVIEKPSEIERAWDSAISCMRGDEKKVIVEEFIHFDFEITLLTIKQWDAPTQFVQPIGHLQINGDYRESWIPAKISDHLLEKAQQMAKTVTDRLGGAGIFGVEFFITNEDVYFSELSPRPHDTGMVTMISQDLSEFDLHIRAILGLPIPQIQYYGPAASAVVLADRSSSSVEYLNVAQALNVDSTQIRIFGKPNTRPNRRMAVALARGENIEMARQRAVTAADMVKLEYKDTSVNPVSN